MFSKLYNQSVSERAMAKAIETRNYQRMSNAMGRYAASGAIVKRYGRSYYAALVAFYLTAASSIAIIVNVIHP